MSKFRAVIICRITHAHRTVTTLFHCSQLLVGSSGHVRRVKHIMAGAMQQGGHMQAKQHDMVHEKHAPLRFGCLRCGLACHHPAGQQRSGWAWLPECRCRPVESGTLAAPKPNHTAQLPETPTTNIQSCTPSCIIREASVAKAAEKLLVGAACGACHSSMRQHVQVSHNNAALSRAMNIQHDRLTLQMCSS